jgi:hypothetical protein
MEDSNVEEVLSIYRNFVQHLVGDRQLKIDESDFRVLKGSEYYADYGLEEFRDCPK